MRRQEQAQQRVSEEASICIRDVNGTAILLLGLSLFHLGPFYLLDRLQSADGTDTSSLTPKEHEPWKRNMDKVIACAYARGYLLHTKFTVRDTQKREMCF